MHEIVESLLRRSPCRVQMAAAIFDNHGVFSWGWNNPGVNGLGEHAEICAIKRATKKRLKGATLVVAGRYRKSGGSVEALPCEICYGMAKDAGIKRIIYRTRTGEWRTLHLT